MSQITDQQLALAQVYGRSMLDLAEGAGSAEDLLDELQEAVRLMERDPAFASFIESPMIDVDDRRRSLETALRGRGSDLFVNSLQVLNQKGRMDLLPAVAQAYRQLLQSRRGRIDARVTTAQPLTPELRDRLRQALGRYSGAEVELHETTDPSLLGGLTIEIGDRKIDGSVVRKLREIRHELRRRAGEEIVTGRLEQRMVEGELDATH